MIYIDDGVVGTDRVEVEDFMNQLGQSFQITRGLLSQFLGINIMKLNDGAIFINQCAYTKKILSRFDMDCANPVSTPSGKSYVTDDRK